MILPYNHVICYCTVFVIICSFCRFNGSTAASAQPLYYNDTVVPSNCPAPTTVTATTTAYVTASIYSSVSPTCSNRACPACANNVGATVGVGFGLLIFGLIVGAIGALILCCVLQRYKRTGSFSPPVAKYERQVDEFSS